MSAPNILRDDLFQSAHQQHVFDSANNSYRLPHEDPPYAYSGHHDDDLFAYRSAHSNLHESPFSAEYDAPNPYHYPHSSSYGRLDALPYQEQRSPPPYYPRSSSFESTSSTHYPPQSISSALVPQVQLPSHYHAAAAYHPHHTYSANAAPYSYPSQPPPITPYYYASHGGPSYPPQIWPMSPPPYAVLEFVTDIQPQDVLSGRGGATNSHSGNRAFRTLVKQYQGQYLKAKKKDKPSVASIIVEIIRKKGGRFLRRHDTNHLGEVLYVDIGDDRAREKTCQALREGAPELRKIKQHKRKSGASGASENEEEDDNEDEAEEEVDEEGEECQANCKDSRSKWFASQDHTSTTTEHVTNPRPRKKRVIVSKDDQELEETQAQSLEYKNSGPIMIRPISHFLPKHEWDKEPISIDELPPDDREVYLRDFLPPCPSIRKKRANREHSSTFSVAIAASDSFMDAAPRPTIEASV